MKAGIFLSNELSPQLNRLFIEFFKMNNTFAKVTVKRTRKQASDWEKICVKDISDKRLLYKIYEVLLKFNHKKNKKFE